MITNCPSCGCALRSSDIIGRYICCPACRNEFILQGDTIAELTTKYYPSGLSLEDVIERIFARIIESADKQTAESIRLIEYKEISIPFVDVVDSEKNESLACIAERNPIEIVSISDVSQFKHINSSDTPLNIKCDRIPFDTAKLISLEEDNAYVGETIKYIPIKYIIADIGGSRQKFISYGECTTKFNENEEKESDSTKSTTKTIMSGWSNMLRRLFAILVITAAWYYFCYTYYHFHGFIDLIILAKGLKYFLPFVGVCFGVLLFNSILKDYIADLLGVYNEKRQSKNMAETRQIIIRKFNL